MKKLTEIEVGDQLNGSKVFAVFPIGKSMAIVETGKSFIPFIEGELIAMYCYTFEQALIALVTHMQGYEEAYGFICRMLELSGEKEE